MAQSNLKTQVRRQSHRKRNVVLVYWYSLFVEDLVWTN